jgi:error-prone DNA polymerase
VKGLSRDDIERLVKARNELGGFSSIEQVQRAAGLGKPVMQKLAEADAFGSLSRSRRPAVWEALPLDNAERPLFAAEEDDRAPATLPAMPVGQEVLTDYTTTGLSLKCHPVSLVREQLEQLNVLPASQVVTLPAGKIVRVCGLVLVRQRPGTASGVVFITLEDETGVVNLVVWPKVYERFRPAARHAALLQCDGIIERQGQVVHVMARRMTDRSDLLRGASFHSRDFH